MSLFLKIILMWKRPRIVFFAGKGQEGALSATFQVIKWHFKTKNPPDAPGFFGFLRFPRNGILLLRFDEGGKKSSYLRFLARNSYSPIFVLTHTGEIPESRFSFDGNPAEAENMKNFAENLKPYSRLVLNFDDDSLREMKGKINIPSLVFGFQEKVDLRATDIVSITPSSSLEIPIGSFSGTNFKIIYQGNIVPFWLENLFGKEYVYSALAAAAVSIILGMNLVEASQDLKNHKNIRVNG